MATSRSIAAVLVATTVLALGAGLAYVKRDVPVGPKRGPSSPAVTQTETLSPEERRAREFASRDLSAQPEDVKLRYATAMADATKRVVAIRREALAALRDSRTRAAAEQVDEVRLKALDEQIRLSQSQLERAEVESAAYR